MTSRNIFKALEFLTLPAFGIAILLVSVRISQVQGHDVKQDVWQFRYLKHTPNAEIKKKGGETYVLLQKSMSQSYT